MRTLLWAAPILAGMASPAMARDAVTTKLVSCRSESCLLLSGRRERGTAVEVNGHPVKVEGGRNWRVRLPLDTVRDWSAPYARTVEVGYRDERSGEVLLARPRLPIGLLGHVADLAALVVRVN